MPPLVGTIRPRNRRHVMTAQGKVRPWREAPPSVPSLVVRDGWSAVPPERPTRRRRPGTLQAFARRLPPRRLTGRRAVGQTRYPWLSSQPGPALLPLRTRVRSVGMSGRRRASLTDRPCSYPAGLAQVLSGARQATSRSMAIRRRRRRWPAGSPASWAASVSDMPMTLVA
jgi:hypothetical protein